MAVCGVMILACLPAPQSSALAFSADATYFPMVAPVLISSYKTSNGAKTIDYIEIYNSGSQPINVQDWTLIDTVRSSVIPFTARYGAGLLEPNRHAVVSREGYVANSSYVLSDYIAPAAITGLSLSRDGYRTVTNSFNTTTAAMDKFMTRNMTTTGYSAAASPFEVSTRPLLADGVTRQVFDDGLYVPPALPKGLKIVEVYSYSSACSPFDESILCSDYVKLANLGSDAILLDDFVLRTDSNSNTRTSSNTVTLTGEIAPGEHVTVWRTDTGGRLSLTNSGGFVWIEDLWGFTPYRTSGVAYPAAASTQQGYSFAAAQNGEWLWTTTPQPTGANVITEAVVVAAACPEGKYRNPETGRCRNIEEAVNALAVCAEGEERNPATGRCRKLAVKTATTLVPCGEGQERNPATNRCRSIASAVAELIPCNDGYERNPATNRCRKIPVSDMPLAAFPVEPTKPAPQTIGLWLTAGGIVAAGMGYAVWEWRREVLGGIRRAATWVTGGRK